MPLVVFVVYEAFFLAFYILGPASLLKGPWAFFETETLSVDKRNILAE
jgi:hypothetical protein